MIRPLRDRHRRMILLVAVLTALAAGWALLTAAAPQGLTVEPTGHPDGLPRAGVASAPSDPRAAEPLP